MTGSKKDRAVDGDDDCQFEWMKEEVSEFYEAINSEDLTEIRDEALGLIRTFQQFETSPRVRDLWYKVRDDVHVVFRSRRVFLDTFKKWHTKKLKKGQAKGVVPEELIKVAGLTFSRLSVYRSS